jgi:sRNA-binding protein
MEIVREGSTKKKPRISRDEYEETLKYLMDCFSTCFSEKTPKPLKIGIRIDLQRALKERGYDISSNRLNGFMRNYCTKRAYILSHNEGEGRVDLTGNIVGYVTKEQAESIKKLLPKPKKPGFKGKRKVIPKA